MSYSVPTWGDDRPERPIPHLDPVEARILGCLLEKQQATPETYPMTLNALVAACNQKSNREPVMALEDDEVRAGIARLVEHRLVRELSGARATRWEHVLDYRLPMSKASRAILTVLLLRGAQTSGELRTRTERLHPIAGVAAVEEELAQLAARSHPLAVELPRRPGQKEARWAHLLGDVVEPELPPEGSGVRRAATDRRTGGERPEGAETLVARLERLEQLVGEAAEELARLRASLS